MTAPLTSERINLCEFLRRVASLSEDALELDGFKKLVECLEIPDALLEEHMHFTEDSYARNLICVTPRFEMIVMCWMPGQFSTIHDHLDSFAVTKVVRGALINTNYRRVDDGSREGYARCELINEEILMPGSWLTLDRGAIHQMRASTECDEALVTLHYYARPLREINVYQPEEDKVERVRLVYSLLHF